jgi:glycosyltransferase involved in cell wall biosynthesis
LGYGQAAPGSALESIAQPQSLEVIHLQNLYLLRSERLIYQRGLLRLLHSGMYNVVIAEFNPRIVSNVVACFYARVKRIPFIWWGRGDSRRFFLRRLLVNIADAVILYGEDEVGQFVARGVPRQKIFVAQNSMDVETINELVQTHQFNERMRILFVGRLIPRKKVDVLLHAFARAYAALRYGTRLTIIGDGPERAQLEQLASQLGIAEHTDFIGAVYEQELLARWFNEAWVSVAAGQMGLAAVHSLAYGVPIVVARDEPHAPEVSVLEHAVNAFFFPSGDIEQLASCLVQLGTDQALWTTMAKAAHHSVGERFGLANMVQGFEQAITYARSRRK